MAINFIFYGKIVASRQFASLVTRWARQPGMQGTEVFLLLCRRCLPTSVFVGQTVRYNREVLSEGH
ncbi:MAG: hypothetical protein C0613_00965 [Desulfobulbaceae bacterium]|nr:MAG: hypothetical protein C0613_00965 [Desulfobulbaceae bacterium]